MTLKEEDAVGLTLGGYGTLVPTSIPTMPGEVQLQIQ